jgi:hypothetical protein
MTMNSSNIPTNFLDAMERHFQDAEYLWRRRPKRLANADHLYGLAAECGLKALMSKFVNNFFDHIAGKPVKKADQAHANKIWLRYQHYCQGYLAIHYSLPLCSNPFACWDVAERYAQAGHFSQTRVNGHRLGAMHVKHLIEIAKSRGDLP